MERARGSVRHIGRYLARSAIAKCRIHSYDGENVPFWYKSHENNERVEETVTAQVFIGRLLMIINFSKDPRKCLKCDSDMIIKR
ncbi:transposase [Clostridium sp. DSM 17811]|nr:transposase [Clostridium sp. DSM 17811]